MNDNRYTENDMPNLMPGFSGTVTDRERMMAMERRRDGWRNFIVFAIVFLALVPIFRWGPQMFRVQSEDHFLIGLPLTDLKALQPVLGDAPPPRTSEYMNCSTFIILWGPWDEISCNLLQQIWFPLQNAQKNPKFKVVPIAYFAKTTEPVKWYEMSMEERQLFIEQKHEEERRIGRFVQNSFRKYGFEFPHVWWDPVDQFRQDMTNIALDESKSMRWRLNGFGFPTLIYAENGVVRKVWTSNSVRDVEEIIETLKIIASDTKVKTK